MSYNYNYDSVNMLEPKNTEVQNSDLYTRVLLWLALQFSLITVSTAYLGPHVPESFIMPMYLALLASMIIASFTRKMRAISPIFAIVVPVILGVALYSTLNFYVATGAGDLIVLAALGTAVIFITMAIWGYTSSKTIYSWAGKMFVILLSVIGLSLLNYFVFQLAILELLISIVVIVLFSIYIFLDIQTIRDNRNTENAPASLYALNLFLNIYNIFVSLLRVLSAFTR